MKTVLITGAGPTGVTGRAIKEYLQNYYEILAPSSKELDLTNEADVRAYFDSHTIDYVVHCATYRSKISQTTHMVDEEFESNLRMYFNLAAQSDKFLKMVYLGSGAEYDKTRPIINISEEQFGEHIPKDKYGFGKYIMNQHCRNSKNIYNLRMFGTLNKYERYTKNVVCNLCAKAVMGLPLTLRQDVRFSWVDINDVAKCVVHMLSNDMRYHDYNIAYPQSYTILDIDKIIGEQQGVNRCEVQNDGMNLEYTCNITRYTAEFPVVLTDIRKSIVEIYNYLDSIKNEIKIEGIDNRWKK